MEENYYHIYFEELNMKIVVYFNFIISVLFTICYFYQFVYVIIGLLKKPRSMEAKTQHKYAVVVSARNEANMIGNLIVTR